MTASEVAALGTVEAIKARFHCTRRAAEHFLTSAKRAVAQGNGHAELEPPAPVAATHAQTAPEGLTPEQQEFMRMTDKYFRKPTPNEEAAASGKYTTPEIIRQVEPPTTGSANYTLQR